MAITPDDVFPPIEGWRDVLRLCVLQMPNPYYDKNIQLCLEGIIEALLRVEPNMHLSCDRVRSYFSLSALLTLNLDDRRRQNSGTKLDVYLATLPGVRLRTCSPGWRWKTGLKRHDARMRGGRVSLSLWFILRRVSGVI